MTKDTTHVKALNIIRPSSLKRVGPQPSLVAPTTNHSASMANQAPIKRGIINAAKIHETSVKPRLNVFHPPILSARRQEPQPKQVRPGDMLHKTQQQPMIIPPPTGPSLKVARSRVIASPARVLVHPPKRSSAATALTQWTESDSEGRLEDTDDDTDDDTDNDTDDATEQETKDDADASDNELATEKDPIEARVNRKIADLEISNQSLLAVNTMLETTVRRQALQVAQLKKLASPGETLVSLAPIDISCKELSEEEGDKDEVFQRLFKVTEQLIKQAESALSFQYKGSGKVLPGCPPDK